MTSPAGSAVRLPVEKCNWDGARVPRFSAHVLSFLQSGALRARVTPPVADPTLKCGPVLPRAARATQDGPVCTAGVRLRSHSRCSWNALPYVAGEGEPRLSRTEGSNVTCDTWRGIRGLRLRYGTSVRGSILQCLSK